MNAEQLVAHYQQGKRDFVWADLEGACLQGIQLAEANFNRAKFGAANLVEADLRRVNFFKADLSYADLTGARLEGVSFRKANLTGAKIELAQIPCTALRGAILPDGSFMQLEGEPPGEEIAVTPACEVNGLNTVAATTVVAPELRTAQTVADAQLWAQGLTAPGMLEPEPVPHPQTGVAVWQVLPQKPLSLVILGYFVDGLTLHLCAADGTAWVVSAIAILLWAVHESLSWFIPLVIGVAVLFGNPASANAPALVVAGAVVLMLLTGLKVAGWTWPKAIYGAVWCGCITAVCMGMTFWLIMPGVLILTPTLVLAFMLVLAMGLIGLGMTSLGAMTAVGLNQRQQMLAMAASGLIGLSLGRLCGAFFG